MHPTFPTNQPCDKAASPKVNTFIAQTRVTNTKKKKKQHLVRFYFFFNCVHSVLREGRKTPHIHTAHICSFQPYPFILFANKVGRVPKRIVFAHQSLLKKKQTFLSPKIFLRSCSPLNSAPRLSCLGNLKQKKRRKKTLSPFPSLFVPVLIDATERSTRTDRHPNYNRCIEITVGNEGLTHFLNKCFPTSSRPFLRRRQPRRHHRRRRGPQTMSMHVAC